MITAEVKDNAHQPAFLYGPNLKTKSKRDFNKEALNILATKKSQIILDQQSIGTAYIPNHSFKANFLDYFKDFAKKNKNQHLSYSRKQLIAFVGGDFIAPATITENFCKEFRQYLLDKYEGQTPTNYYRAFKSVLAAATTDRYFLNNPTTKVLAKGNPSTKLKENLEIEDYLKILKKPCLHEDIRAGFLLSCYTGLRRVDTEKMEWSDIKDGVVTTRIIQSKTGQPVVVTLHPIAQEILAHQRVKYEAGGCIGSKVFSLPSRHTTNRIINKWMESAGVSRYITWSCARLSFSILLGDENVDDATRAALLGHTTTKMVNTIYKRHRPKDQTRTISLLPSPEKETNVPETYGRVARIIQL